MINLSEVQAHVYKLGETAEIPRKYLSLREFSPQDGSPHVEISADEYEYVVQERGVEISRRKTKSLDEILFLVLYDMVSKYAYAYELENRNSSSDSRRMVFEMRYELMNRINPKWGVRAKNIIFEILLRSPYVDDFNPN